MLTAGGGAGGGTGGGTPTPPTVQLVGMSATLPNVAAAATWLRGAVYETHWRPVPLEVVLKVGSDLMDADGHVVRRLDPDAVLRAEAEAEAAKQEQEQQEGGSGRPPPPPPRRWAEARDPDLVVWLARETVRDGHSALIFCATRRACREVARQVAEAARRGLLRIDERRATATGRLPAHADAAAIEAAGGLRNWFAAEHAQLRVSWGFCFVAGERGLILSLNARWRAADDAPLAPLSSPARPPPPPPSTKKQQQGIKYSDELLSLVSQGVAYHSTELTSDERLLVEEAFACGAISVLAATSTLAAGVNLPVRRVIFKHAYVGKVDQTLDATKFRQMCGRAGRKGIDERGEAVLLTGPSAGGAASLDKLRALAKVRRERGERSGRRRAHSSALFCFFPFPSVLPLTSSNDEPPSSPPPLQRKHSPSPPL